MKNAINALFVLLLAVPSAHAEITVNTALTTDYVWRGISQNQEDPALQGGFDYAHESGFYTGVWGSNVNFGGASTELDVYAGWSADLESGVGLDFGVIRYAYVGSDAASDNDFTEFYANLSYGGFGFNYSLGDEFGDQYEFKYSHNIGAISLATAYGSYDVNDDGNGYDYYSLGVSGNFGDEANLSWDINYWDTDIKSDDTADGRVVFSISKEF